MVGTSIVKITSARHRAKFVMQLHISGKAMIHMLHVLGLANCSTTSIAMIKRKIHQTNLDVLERTNAGKVVGYAVGKRDFDNFFGAVPHFLVERSVKWLESKWCDRLSRRPYISGPKFKPRKSCSLQFAFTRAFKENLRNADSSHKLHKTFHSNTRAVRKNHWILHFRDVNSCVKFDIHCGFICIGSEFIRPRDKGVTQGSCLSMGIADTVGCYIEYDFRVQHFWNSSMLVTLHLRFVDDIYVQVYAFGINDSRRKAMNSSNRRLTLKGKTSAREIPLSRQLLDEVAQTHLEDIWQRYESHFSVKVEDPITFVGLSMSTLNDFTLSLTSDVPTIADCRFQHARGYTPRAKKIAVIQSQLAAIFDRTMNQSPVNALTRTINCFLKVGFSRADITKSAAKFLRTHPYLHAQLVLALRRSFNNADISIPLLQRLCRA